MGGERVKDKEIATIAFCDIIYAIDQFNEAMERKGIESKAEYPDSVQVNGRRYVFCDVCDVVSRATQEAAREPIHSDP